jgi:FkbM family methyltransferase
VNPLALVIKNRYARWTLQGMHAAGIKTINHSLLGGGKMILDTDDFVAQRIRCEEAFEPAVRREMERIASDGVNVIDIGANIGYYSILASRLVGPEKRVFSFEPQASMVTKLRRNIECNGLRNVEVFPFALADAHGKVTFQVPPKGLESLGSMHTSGRFEVAATVEVEVHRLDDVMHKLENPKIGLVKIDAEGAELLILRGATHLLSLPDRPVLIFEANEKSCEPFGYTVFDTLEYVHSFGYRLRQIDYENWIAKPVGDCEERPNSLHGSC